MAAENIIQLLVVDESPNHTETLVSALRNSGLAVHATHVADPGVLEHELPAGEIDLILYSVASDQADMEQALRRCDPTARNVPVLLLCEQREPASLAYALAKGARDVIAREDLPHLRQVLSREYDILNLRRQVAALEKHLEEAEKRCTTLMDNAPDGICYAAEGIHLYANPAYARMFGFASTDELENTPVMDLICPGNQDKLKSALRKDPASAAQSKAVSCHGTRQDGSSFAARIAFQAAVFEGEPCTWITVRSVAPAEEAVEEPPPTTTEPELQTGTVVNGSDTDDEMLDPESAAALIDYGLQENRFQLVFQPVVSLHNAPDENYSTLVRLMDPEGNERLPVQFLHAARSAGRMVEVDHWIIHNALKTLAEQRGEGNTASLFVKMSGTTLTDAATLPAIAGWLQCCAVEPAWCAFQVDSHEIRADPDRALQSIQALRELGCRFALDSVGKADESLLESLPLDFIWLDSTLTAALGKRAEALESLTHLTSLARNRGIRAIAKGVEDAATLAQLWTLGVDYVHGFFLRTPSSEFDYDFSTF